MLRPTPGFSFFKFVRVLLPIAAVVCAASGLITYQAVSTGPVARVAGEAKMQLLRDEHDAIAAYVAGEVEARKLANASADSDAARVRLAAQGEIRRQAQLAATEQARRLPVAEVKAVALRTPARTSGREVAAAEPLPLAPPAAPQVTQPAQARVADGPVRSRLRELASDVRRIPSILQSAASWVADAVPAPKLPSLPLVRQFSASI